MPCTVAGSIARDGVYSRPVVMRRIGFGRFANDGEAPSFLVSALFAYPRELGLALPWNERLHSSDDIFIGALWRSHGVHLDFAPSARATHDSEHQFYGADKQAFHIYTKMFDALFANPDLGRALSYEFIGFAAGAKLYFRTSSDARRYITAWVRGHRDLIRDRHYLRALVSRELPDH